ncbi:MAG: hypothetical protein JSW73_04690 [Candidatus Woesearchaeota archaeon]|nr:MAG: hypothetical protein JSW73_04690 [Candidatus Woesearchaeota archaeon]
MKKAQSVMIYGILTVVLGVIVLSSTFMLSKSISESNSKEMAILISDTILAKAENKILESKALGEFSDNEIRFIIDLPKRIGNREYSIVGGGDKLSVRILGTDTIIRKRKIGSNITTYGISFPPSMEIIYDPFTNSVTIK